MKRLLCVCVLLTLLGAAPAPLRSQAPPTIAFELSPGHDLPWDASLIGTITLSNLDFSSYSSVVFHADITGHEDRTSGCFGEHLVRRRRDVRGGRERRQGLHLQHARRD